MRPKSLVLLILALGCGLVASIGISQVMDNNRQAPTTVETEPIYIAKVDINLGDPIKAEMVSLEEWPKDKIPVGSIRELADIENSRPRAKIFVGEPILEAKLLNKGDVADPTETIPPGFRVLPISVKADTGMAGLINPGDRVDVQWFIPKNQSLNITKTTTKTILHNIRVFAIDQNVQRLQDGEEVPTLAKTVSLLVTPKQSNMLRLADHVGEISLVARHPDDIAADEASEVDFEDLLVGKEKSSRKSEQGDGKDEEKENGGFFGSLFAGVKAQAAAAGAAAAMQRSAPFRMEVISGDEVSVELFSPIDGKRIDEDASDFLGGAYGAPAAGSFSGATPTPSTGGGEDDFPIDLQD